MATLDFLPPTTYRPPSPVQVRRRRRSLNTIMEDDEESARGSVVEVHKDPDILYRKADWLSPLSDHFPTPRGHHFMSAPILPSSTSPSDTESVSPTSSSAPWTRDSFSTEATEFDDLYDVSSDDETQRRKSTVRKNNSRPANNSRRSSLGSATSSRGPRSSLPALVIPTQGDPWPGVAAFKFLTSPVPPTPPPKVPMSPAIFSYLQSQEVPSCSAPPSLDGSLTSEQMAVMSAPPTPDVGDEDPKDSGHWGGGVQLQPAAMATLQALSGGDDYFEQQTDQVIELTESPQQTFPIREMQQSLPPLITNIHRNDSIILSPDQQQSLDCLTRLEIPSPGGFFSALSHSARHTWHLVACTPESAHPPSSTTAEHFYKTPWSSAPVERIVEVSDASETMSDGLPTARPNLNQQNIDSNTRSPLQRENSNDTITGHVYPQEEEIVPDEIIANFEPGYAEKLRCIAVTNIDRTGMWLAAQSSYLAELINPTEARDDEVALLKRAASTRSQAETISAPVVETPPRKTVRFSEMVLLQGEEPCPLPKINLTESAYYRAFQHLLARSRYRDTFIHRIPRFEAIQAQRVSFPVLHRAQLLGKYQLSVLPSTTKKRMSANVARGDEAAPEDPAKFKRDKEYEALTQMSPATWNVMALKLLNGGRLLATPVAKRLARLSSMGPKPSGRDRARILDLGGQATCDWAWYCAFEYPNTKVYTVTTKGLRQLSNSNIRGPRNHRQVAVEKLIRLPFKNEQFDIISAREIYTILREKGENGEDEWETCLSECLRVLKPGGYLEFSVLDSDIVNAGPLGLAKSVEFGFNLKTLGYDPTPTKSWIQRLSKAGFVSVKRAWVFLPMGSKRDNKVIERDSLGVERKLELEAMVQGSTADAGTVTGVVGAWAWEKWLCRCEVLTLGEKAGIGGGWVNGVSEIVEEGKGVGAGWRVLSGWARKPGRKL